MSVSAVLKMLLSVKDISTDTYVSATDASRTWSGANLETTLNATSTPDGETGIVTLVTLSAGAATLDLTSMLHRDGDTRTAAGKKIRAIFFYNPSSNLITATKGASNGHSPVGSTFTIPLAASGGRNLWYMPDATAITNSSNDTIDFAGTGTDTVLVIVVVG